MMKADGVVGIFVGLTVESVVFILGDILGVTESIELNLLSMQPLV